MIQLLTILAFLSLHVRDALLHEGARGHGPATTAWPWTIGELSGGQTVLLVLGALGCCALAAHTACAAAGRLIDRSGSLASFARAERMLLGSRVVATALFIVAVFALDWLGVVRRAMGDLVALDEALALLPLFATFMLTWGSAYPIEQRFRDAVRLRELDSGLSVMSGPTRWESVLASTRHGLLVVALPILLITAWQEALSRLSGRTGLSIEAEGWTLSIAGFAGTILVFILSPAMLRRIWDTVPLGPGETRDMLERLSARHRVRMREPLVWRTHGSLVNGAVLGLVWPFRYVLFTDLLLERLLPRQVEAVAAHELGHIRNTHIFWLAIAAAGTILLSELVTTRVAILLGVPETPITAVLETAFPLSLGVFVFGWVSRRFEWQADAFAAKHLSETIDQEADAEEAALAGRPHATPPRRPAPILAVASNYMESALREVARLNGADPARWSFRHGSIDERLRRLRGIVGLAPSMIPIDNTVRWIKVAALLVFLLAITGVIVEPLLQNGR